jgi:phage shock protein PspC (stress-responsive transcriptional regulator)
MQPPPSTQSFYRGSDRIVGGVCSGLAEGIHVEVLWVRLAFVVLTFLNGVGLLLYVVLWFLMPDRAGHRPAGETVASMGTDLKRAWADLRSQISGSRPATPPTASANVGPPPPAGSVPGEPAPAASSSASQAATQQPSFILGAILIVIGIAFLVANLNIVTWSIIWPAALVALGVALLIRNLEKRSDK